MNRDEALRDENRRLRRLRLLVDLTLSRLYQDPNLTHLEALQLVEGDWGVFVKQGDEAVFRRVRRGADVGGDVLVLEGLEPGLEVATQGAYLLRPLWMKRMGEGEEHAH